MSGRTLLQCVVIGCSRVGASSCAGFRRVDEGMANESLKHVSFGCQQTNLGLGLNIHRVGVGVS